MINLDNKNKVLFTHINENLFLSINNIINLDFSFNNIYKADQNPIIQTINSFIIKCFVTNNNFIECLYIGTNTDNNKYYYVAIYNELLEYLDNIILDSSYINFNWFPYFYRNAANAIYLKKEIGVFAYYLNSTYMIFSPLIIKLMELYFEGNIPNFKNIISEEVIEVKIDKDEYDYFGEPGEFMIKINDNQFCYSLLYSNILDSNSIIVLILFDLYGTNNDNLLVRYYKIKTNLYNLKTSEQLMLFKYNSFLGMAFICEDE